MEWLVAIIIFAVIGIFWKAIILQYLWAVYKEDIL